MIDKNKINILFQIISSIEDAVAKMEKAYEKKDIGNFEYAKKTILEFQERLAEEIG